MSAGCLNWTETASGDLEARSGAGVFLIEHASYGAWWAYKNGRPVGMYPSRHEAKARCADLHGKEGEE